MKKQNLLIVESPAKVKTINQFFKNHFYIEATVGHIADLPQGKLGINLKKNFELDYQILAQKQKILNQILSKSKNVENIYLATDPDREGEFISFFLAEKIKKLQTKNIYRIRFSEITKKAIEEAISKKGIIDQSLVQSQKARRVVDRLIGFLISPILWKNFPYKPSLSAGRVQSVILNWICDREKEIENFVKKPYFNIFIKVEKEQNFFTFEFFGEKEQIQEDEIQKFHELYENALNPTFQITKVEKHPKTQPSPLPFTTASLEKTAFQLFGFSAKKTLQIAQKLYEGKKIADSYKGLITYIRTDSIALSKDFVQIAQKFIQNQYGKHYLGNAKNKKYAHSQNAHEAIRPSNDFLNPDQIKTFLTKDEFLIYHMIWKRTIASLMSPEKYTQHLIEGVDSVLNLNFRFVQKEQNFDGWKVIYQDFQKSSFQKVDFLEKEILPIADFSTEKKYTQAPPRWSEASLIEQMQKLGIGRPSTYAVIIDTLLKRKYIEKFQKKLKPTELGFEINDFLQKHFCEIFNNQFTSNLEKELESIALGKKSYLSTLENFYKHLQKNLSAISKPKNCSESKLCPTCTKHPILIKTLKNRKKYEICHNYPYCDYMKYV